MPASKSDSAGKPWEGLAWGWKDAAAKPAPMTPSVAAERAYARQLKSVAGRVRQIVAGVGDAERKMARLREYAQTLQPWAEQAAANMLGAVDRRNAALWERQAGRIGAGLRQQLATAVNGVTLRRMLEVHASLIRSRVVEDARQVRRQRRLHMAHGAGWRGARVPSRHGGALRALG